MDSVGVERRRLPFTLIENVVLEDEALEAADVLVYLALAKHADGEGTCWPSMATIAKVARVCRSNVAQAIKRLETLGYIRRTARFRPDGGVTSNVYKLLQMEVAPPVQQADTPRPTSEQPPVQQADTNHIQSEPDTKKGQEEHAIASSDPHSPSSLIQSLREEAGEERLPLKYRSKETGLTWSEGVQALETKHGVSRGRLLEVFAWSLEHYPEKLLFFPDNYSRYCREIDDAVRSEMPSDKRHADERCPECHVRGSHGAFCTRPAERAALAS